jgi:Xaa-Pro aminopeptidase
MNYISRQKQLATLLRGGGFDALLVTHLPNVLYLCGFTGTAGVLLFQVSDRGHKATFYTDGRYDQQAHAEVKNAKVVVGKKAAFAEACEGAQKAKTRTLGFEAEHLSYSAYKQIGLTVRGGAAAAD